MINSDVVNIISVSLLWLADHVLSEHIEVSILNGGFEVSVMVLLMFLTHFFLEHFKFTCLDGAVAEDIT